MSTVRQKMIERLSERPYTPLDLSSEIRLSVKDILYHLAHVKKSIHPPRRFIVGPALCLKCGYVFKDRKKLHAPSKCPKCKGTQIQDPTYSVAV